MRVFVLLILALFLVACDASPLTGHVVDEQHMIDHAFESDKACIDEYDCGVGRVCVNQTCQPKPVEP